MSVKYTTPAQHKSNLRNVYADAFNAAFKEYSASLLNKDKRPSVLAKLHELVQAAAELPGKVRHKEQERGL